jgi:glycosyltransferase involved in cell wall biosynthesis
MKSKMTVLSIIIPTHNEEKDIFQCLKSLTEQSFKKFEVIIVDDGSTDKTLEIVKRFSKVRIFEQNHKGPGVARNLGAKNSKGDILIFIDSDMTFDKDYLKNLIEPIISDRTGQIIGATHEQEIVENTSNIWGRCWGKIRVSKENAKDVKVFRAIRRDAFFQMQGFDPKYGYADDQTFWFKYGKRPKVAEGAICYHKNPETLKGVYRQSRWIGASIDNIFIKIPLISYLVPLILVIYKNTYKFIK